MQRLRLRFLDSLWAVPVLAVVASIALSVVLTRWDENDPVELSRSISAGSAESALSALAAGMLAFTGFVTSIVLLVVQFGSSQLSTACRLHWLRRDHTVQLALSAFIATFLFALVSTVDVGRGDPQFVPTRTLVAALALTLLSIAMFLVLVERTSNGLRVANVVQRIDLAARRVIDVVYPPDAAEAARGEETVQSIAEQVPVQVVANGAVGAIFVSFDQRRLGRLAARGDAVIELVYPIGDHVPASAPLLRVYAADPIDERRLRKALVLGDERTIDDDPSFAIRMLADVAIKALSPAVNDPTTAVQVLGRIEDILRYAAAKQLSVGVVIDDTGTTRLVFPTTSWDNLVELSLTEIRAFGSPLHQVARRLRALLEALLADLPAFRHPPLLEQLRLLDRAVQASYDDEERKIATVADRQGLGMAWRRGQLRE